MSATLRHTLLSLSAALVATACGAPASQTETDGGSSSETSTDTDTDEGTDTGGSDIVDELWAIDGLRVVEELPSDEPGVRLFELGFLQPADHDDVDAGFFEQKLYLRHRDQAAPMVLFTTGYHIYVEPQYESEPATLLQANQLSVEQRFFADSRPWPVDWSLLTIAQAAADHHRIIAALRPIYAARWLSTGGSKGGMTSIYHRRFYPDDVDATVAYVAPHSFALRDQRYVEWLEQIGDPDCAQAIRDMQVIALARRATLMALLAAEAQDKGYSFTRYGGLARAFEAGVIEVRWSFWQYRGVAYCPSVPTQASSDTDIHSFIDQHLGWDSYDDAQLAVFEPYYYQAATQLGAPAITEPHLEGLLVYPVDAGWRPLLPASITEFDYDPTAMPDISAWMSDAGERLMFVNGEWDPWSGGAFDPGNAVDTHVYWVAQGTHRSKLSSLPDAQFDAAVEILDTWMNVDRSALMDARALRAFVQPLPELHRPRR